MKILVIGGGGREHAVIKTIKKNPEVTTVYALPGNGGIAADAQCFPVKATDLDGICAFVKEHSVDFAVVTPDDPLVLGLVDRLEALGVPCFGPKKDAAIIEGSKIFSKNFMKRHHIPTAAYETFESAEDALNYLKNSRYPTVIKADGLALGKGAVIVGSFKEAEETVKSMMVDKVFGTSGTKIVVEEFMEGPEVSVLSFTDGETIVPMVSSMDHKRAQNGDMGLNTGGMGTVAPNPCYTKEIAKECMEKIFLPTIRGLKEEGRTFQGCLYFGLMLTKEGPKVVEYNCRFGDPETQVVLPLLKSDLLSVMRAVRDGKLGEMNVEFSEKYACCVVMASKGYPQKYDTGYEISLPKTGEGEQIYIAGAKKEGDLLKTSGGRVLGAVALGDTLYEAIQNAYALSDKIHFANAYRRDDIGARALKAEEK